MMLTVGSRREALLAEIEANPECDTIRLAYADHLEESGAADTRDRDRATVEFIRLSCGKEINKTRQHVHEGRWLEANWWRLVPGVHVDHTFGVQRKGRWLTLTVMGWDWGDVASTFNIHHCRVEFWRGFVRRVICAGAFGVEEVLPQLVIDQPLVCPETTNIANGFYTTDWPNVTTTFTQATMGKAWPILLQLTTNEPNCTLVTRPPFDWQLIVKDDHLGNNSRRLMREAFRLYARSSGRKS